MNKKAQGALEYLLLIGGAVLIAAIALAILSGLGGAGQKTIETGTWTAQCSALGQNYCENSNYSDFGTAADGYCDTPVLDCAWNVTAKVCEPNFSCA